MCGILGILLANRDAAVNQELYDGMTMLQHRGQDAAGMVVGDKKGRMHMHKDCGLVRDVFKLQHMIKLLGFYGIAHCRYPTSGASSNVAEAQPFSTNIPYGMCIVHNGNLTNTKEIHQNISERFCYRATDSDSELLLSVLADELLSQPPSKGLGAENIFQAIRGLMRRTRGGYAALVMFAGIGIVAFRDPFGIRPLCMGKRSSEVGGAFDYIIASESVAVESLGYSLERDVKPGEAIWFSLNGEVKSMMCHDNPILSPCVFEYVYFGRPDSIIDGVSVYRARQLMGNYLAEKIRRQHDISEIDVVCPVPDTSRVSALQCALALGLPYEEGLTKNRYIARTFIMPGQAKRVKNVRKKLNPIRSVFEGKRVLLIDDSIVRGTTSQQTIDMCRDQGALKVFLCSASAPVCYPNVYGIDMPVQSELVAYGRNEKEIAKILGADWVVYSDIEDMEKSVTTLSLDKSITQLDCSCFTGKYVTGDIDETYLEGLRMERNDAALVKNNGDGGREDDGGAKKRANAAVPVIANVGGDLLVGLGVPPPPPVGVSPRVSCVPEEGDDNSDPAISPKQKQPVRRGRQIAGINKASNDDFRRLQDRFSGWS